MVIRATQEWSRQHHFVINRKSDYYIIRKGELEGNCDFSSNNYVWTRFYDFLSAIVNFVGLILLWKIDWNLVHGFCWQPFWIGILDFRLKSSDFRLRISEIGSPHWAFVLLYRYIFVCEMEKHSEDQPSKHIISVGKMMYHCLRR